MLTGPRTQFHGTRDNLTMLGATVPHDLVFRGGLIVTPFGVIHGGVAVDQGVISQVGADSSLGDGRREVNLDGRVLFPGLVDPHIHFGAGDEVGDDTMREDFRHNTKDCLVGGVTTIVSTTLPSRDPLDQIFNRALHCAEGNSYCDYKFTSIVSTEEQISTIPAVAEKGCVSYKFFTGYIGEEAEGFGMNPEGVTPELFFAACEQLAGVGAPAFAAIHAEEPHVRGILIDRIRQRTPSGRLLAGWAEASPDWAESVQVYSYGLIAHEAGVPLYPVHISSKYTLDTIDRLKTDGVNIVGETLALFLNTTAEEMDERNMGAKAKIKPPIRHAADRESLWRALRTGTLSIVGTDSLTYSVRYKEGVDFWECRVGVNLQVGDTLPLMLSEGIHAGRLDYTRLGQTLSTNAARRFGMYPKKGAIAVGSDADLVVIDPDKEIVLGVDRYRGLTDYSLWEGRKVRGAPVMTFLRGQMVMEDGEVATDQPHGEYIKEAWAS